MEFKYMLMGVNMKKTETGFSSGGTWTLRKCFYGKDEDYGEFYLNIDMDSNNAEIVPKDIEYASVLEKAFKNMVYFIEGKNSKELVDWNRFEEVLIRLAKSQDQELKRHSQGLLKALKVK